MAVPGDWGQISIFDWIDARKLWPAPFFMTEFKQGINRTHSRQANSRYRHPGARDVRRAKAKHVQM
jgi:hypothetical protein